LNSRGYFELGLLNNVRTLKNMETLKTEYFILHYEMSVSLWESEAECYGLSMKCLPQVYVLNMWSLAIDAVLGGSENFTRWSLAGGSRSLGAYP
jgi:hypothetical protein